MLMLLCAVTTLWAGPTDLPQITTDVNNPIYYTIVNTRSSQPGGYMYFAGESVGIKDEQVATVVNKHKFYFTGSHDELYVHNAAAPGLKLATIGDGNKAAGSWTAEGAAWAVGVSPKGTGLAFGPKGGLNGNSCWNECNYATAADEPDFTTWSANDDGSVFLVALAEDCEININDFYTIEAPLFEATQGVKKGLVVNEDGSLGWNTIDLTNKNCYWIPTTVNGQTVALKNLGTEKYLNGTEVSTEYVASTVKALGLGQYNIVSNNTTVHANNHGGGSNASGNIVSWGGSVGSASAWQFVEQQDPDAVQAIEITYNFTYNGQALDDYTQTVNTITGAEYPNITVAFPFGVSATKPEGTIAKEDAPAKTVTIAVEENLPFKYAADANSIKNWYYIQQHSSAGYGKYLQYAETYIEWLDATIAVDEVDTYTWAFVGDPFAGFKMVNYGAPADANAVVSNGSGNPSFGAFANATAWNIKASATNKDAEHFCFQYPGSDQYMNAQSGKIAFWGSADQGSTMWVTERDMTGLADLQALIVQVDAAVAAYGEGGTTVGYYTAESVAALATALATAKEAAERNESAAANSAAQAALQSTANALETIQPTEGAFYYIASAMPSSDGRSGQKMYVNNAGAMQFQNAATLANVFQFVPAGDNTFYLYNVERGTYLNTNKPHNGGQATAVGTEGTVKVAIANMGRANVVSIIPNGGAMLHAQASGSQVVAWNNTDNAGASAWIISEVADITELSHALTVGEAGYATLCLGYNATIPALEGEECGVYTAAVIDGYAAMTKVEGVLPANTAVIVKAAAGTYNFNYATGEVSAIENNELKGTTVNKNFTDAAYVLGVVDGEVGLYTAAYNVSTDTTNDGTAEEPAVTYEAWKNNAFKAYLPKAAGMNAASYSFRFPGTTEIENVVVENDVKVIYDLTGRRVSEITEAGIYIVNGKKVLVK